MDRFDAIIVNLLDKSASVTEITICEPNRQPWYDVESKAATGKVRRLESKFKRNQKPISHLAWLEALNLTRRLSRNKAALYWKSEIGSAAGNLRKMWQNVNSILDETKIVAKYYFFPADQQHNMIDKMVSDITASSAAGAAPTYVSTDAPSLQQLNLVSGDNVLKAILSSPFKH